MNAKFKVGDKVEVIDRIGYADDYRSNYIDPMRDLAGKIFTIQSVELSGRSGSIIKDDGYVYTLEEDELKWAWNSSMLKLVEPSYESLLDSKQYFYLIMKDGEPYRINLNPHKILRDARALATTEPEAKISIYRNLIATTSKCELVIDNVKAYKR